MKKWFPNSQLSTLNFQLLIVLVVVCSCTKADIHYRESMDCMLHVLPDQSIHTLPAMDYRFYSNAGNNPMLTPCDGTGDYHGRLATGQYEALAINPDADHVYLSGMNKLQTATAGVHAITSPAGARTLTHEFHAPGMLYSVRTGTFQATAGTTLTLYPTPSLLTRRMVIHFLLDDDLMASVAGIDGILRGVYPEVSLATGQPQAGSVTDMAQSGMTFTTAATNTGYETTLALFGIANPQQGNAYDNLLTATLKMEDDERKTMEIDLNTVLTNVIVDHQGIVPPLFHLYIELKLTAIGVIATVVPWDDDKEIEKEI